MPGVETFDCIDYAVLWEVLDYDNYAVVKVAEPVEILVRWVDTETDSNDAEGNKLTISAEVSAKQVIPVQSVMWHGRLADVPDPPTNLLQVKMAKDTPDVKGRNRRYTFSLTKYKDKLPVYYPGTGS
jgi:hypothetical protein